MTEIQKLNAVVCLYATARQGCFEHLDLDIV